MKKRTDLRPVEMGDPSPIKWNVLTTEWLEVMDRGGGASFVSPLQAISQAGKFDRLVAASPLDLFAAQRFLVTLLYWKAGECGGVPALREKLLKGQVPSQVVASLAGEAASFELFDRSHPFLQDTSVRDAKVLSPAYLFAEMASGTNVAFFDHGDDATCRLCLRCATQGLLRLVPWTQSGGSGKQPSIHGAPPIMVIALGASLSETLGLNLVPMDGPVGTPRWSGQFRPSPDSAGIALMEALTWNPRRVNLLAPSSPATCSRCGSGTYHTVGPIVFEKNEALKSVEDYVAAWRDPAAFYRTKDLKTVKSSDEGDAALESDLRHLFEKKFARKVEEAPQARVMQENRDHSEWLLILPCTNPAHNKSYDHRVLAIHGWPEKAPDRRPAWPNIRLHAGDLRTTGAREELSVGRGAVAFVRAAARLNSASWAVISAAANESLGSSVGAFDVFTSIYWPLRSRLSTLPSRQAAWLTLKLMATAPASMRVVGPSRDATQPWRKLSRRQPEYRLRNGSVRAYPLRIPVDRRLELTLREIIRLDKSGQPVDWGGLCQFIDDTLS